MPTGVSFFAPLSFKPPTRVAGGFVAPRTPGMAPNPAVPDRVDGYDPIVEGRGDIPMVQWYLWLLDKESPFWNAIDGLNVDDALRAARRSAHSCGYACGTLRVTRDGRFSYLWQGDANFLTIVANRRTGELSIMRPSEIEARKSRRAA